MDHQKSSSKTKNTILNFLPRATSSFSFQNPPIYSPTKDKIRSSEKPKHSHLPVGFSGPIFTGDTRRKIKNTSDDTIIVHEPMSPRISCIGQIKCKYTKEKLNLAGNKPATGVTPERTTYNVEDGQKEASKPKRLGFKKLFGGKSDVGKKNLKAPLYLVKAPILSTMKGFSSGRDKIKNVEVAAMDSGEESDDINIEDVYMMPSSAPVMIRNALGFDDDGRLIRVAGSAARKEINLWKRRTMPQPKPLLLHNI